MMLLLSWPIFLAFWLSPVTPNALRTNRQELRHAQRTQFADGQDFVGKNGRGGRQLERFCRTSLVADRYSNGTAPIFRPSRQAAIFKKRSEWGCVCLRESLIIGPSHILTAAHCVTGKTPDRLKVRLGESYVKHKYKLYLLIEKHVASVTIHPEYYPGNFYNDIAILTFESAVDFAENYQHYFKTID